MHSAGINTNRAAVLPLRPVLKVSAPPSTKRFVVFKLEILILLKSLLSCDYYNRSKRTATYDHVVIYILFLRGGGWGIWRKPTCQQCKYFSLLCNVNINDLKHVNQDNPTILSNILENPPFSKF
jgi:hypothetical protein